jgi:hypothetical protein
MKLTRDDLRMLNGDEGPGRQRSMEFLVKMGEAFDAEEMSNAYSAHIHGAMPLDYLEELTEGVNVTDVFATTHANPNPCGIDHEGCQRIGIPENYDIYEYIRGGDPPEKILNIYKRLGYIITHTCTPFFAGNVPAMKRIFTWCGSSGQVLANSWFGAYGNRDSIPFNIAVTVTNRIPLMGMALKKNRNATVVARVEGLDLSRFSDADWGALGYELGSIAEKGTVVIDGLPKSLNLDQFRVITSALPVSGGVCLCHAVGVTPEAPTLQAAIGRRRPSIETKISSKNIEVAYEQLTTSVGSDVDLVALGCPHCSIQEVKKIAELLAGKKVSSNVRLLIAAYRGVWELAKVMGYTDIIKKAGGVLTDTCVGSQNPFIILGPHVGIKVIATNSARANHYIIRESNKKIESLYGSLEDCIEAALSGKWKWR